MNLNTSLASSRVGACPGFRMMKALGTSPLTGSALGTTAASATASCSMRALSSSKGLMR